MAKFLTSLFTRPLRSWELRNLEMRCRQNNGSEHSDLVQKIKFGDPKCNDYFYLNLVKSIFSHGKRYLGSLPLTLNDFRSMITFFFNFSSYLLATKDNEE